MGDKDHDEKNKSSSLRVLTLNCWGIPFVSRDVKKRFFHIAQELASGKYDIVSLQEVWSQSDYDYVRTVVADVLPYAFYYHSGIIGSGVCVFSKYPITDTFTYRYSLNGYMHMIHHGDWYGGKSVCYCIIEHPEQCLHFFTTHLHAEYNRKNDKYLAHRAVQAFQLTEFVNHLTKPSDCVIVCGDMNSEPVDPCYRVIKDIPGLSDAWYEINGQKKGIHGYTCDISSNIYTPSDTKKAIDGKRIDYVFYRSPRNSLKCVECEVTMGQIPDENLPYSDHEAVLATFDLKPQDSTVLLVKDEDVNSQKDALMELANIVQDGLNNTQRRNSSIFLTIVSLLLFIFLPCIRFQTILCPTILHTAQVISAMFLAAYIFHSILLRMDEHQAYRNVKLEVDLQLKQLEIKSP